MFDRMYTTYLKYIQLILKYEQIARIQPIIPALQTCMKLLNYTRVQDTSITLIRTIYDVIEAHCNFDDGKVV